LAPKKVNRDEKRKKIALAALDHFTLNGFSGTSMSQVAKAAHIGKGTIYEYFKSKEDLIGFALYLYVAENEEKVDQVLSDNSDPEKKIRAYVYNVMETFMSDPRSMRILLAIIQMLIKNRNLISKEIQLQDMFRRSRQTIISLIQEGVSQHVFRPEIKAEAETIAINLIAFIDGIWMHSLINTEGTGGFNLHAQVKYHLDHLFKSIKCD